MIFWFHKILIIKINLVFILQITIIIKNIRWIKKNNYFLKKKSKKNENYIIKTRYNKIQILGPELEYNKNILKIGFFL